MFLLVLMAATFVAAILIFFSVIYFLQGSIIFRVPPKNYLLYDKYSQYSYKFLFSDVGLQGWNFNGANQDSNLAVIVFGGNADDAVNYAVLAKRLPVKSLCLVNYRGYGESDGRPAEQFLYKDSLAVFDYVKSKNADLDLAVMGFSLGSAVAGYVAANREVKSIMLLAPLCSVSQISKDKFGRVITRILLKHKFELVEHAKHFKANTLVVCAELDSVIKLSHSMSTYKVLTVKKNLVIVGGIGHNQLFFNPKCLDAISSFLHDSCVSGNK